MTQGRIAAFDAHLSEDRLRLFDVGARGGVAPRWRPFHRYLDALGFEPEPGECDRLAREARSLAYPSRFLPYALGRDSRPDVVFHVARWAAASSLYPPNAELLAAFPYASALLEVVERRRIETVSLDEVCRREGVWPDHLKLDVEGAELDVLIGGETALSGALVLDVEVEFAPIRLDQPLFADVDSHLRQRGWQLIGLRRVHWRRTGGIDARTVGYGGQLIQADALYCNARALAAGLSPPRAMKLLLILAAYRQADFVAALIRGPGPVSRHLSNAWRAELDQRLLPRPTLVQRVLRRMLGAPDPARRREWVDGLQPGDATVWSDADFF